MMIIFQSFVQHGVHCSCILMQPLSKCSVNITHYHKIDSASAAGKVELPATTDCAGVLSWVDPRVCFLRFCFFARFKKFDMQTLHRTLNNLVLQWSCRRPLVEPASSVKAAGTARGPSHKFIWAALSSSSFDKYIL